MRCHARQYSDQMRCPNCGLAWDVNDPDPPDCKKLLTDRKSALICETQQPVVPTTKEKQDDLFIQGRPPI